eukprot:COSAG05_NODE_1425_length_4921_cov_2.177727_2_plen_389_part_00
MWYVICSEAGVAKRSLLNFAYSNFKEVLKLNSAPAPRHATEEDVETFYVKHVVHVRKTYKNINDCFHVGVEFAMAESRAAASRANARCRWNDERKGAVKMKASIQRLLDLSAADILECDVLSDAAFTRLRRWALEEGLNGRATVITGTHGVKVPRFRAVATVRAEELATLRQNDINAQTNIWSNGTFVCVLPIGEDGPEGFTLCGDYGNVKGWKALALQVAARRGMLADGVRLESEEGGEFLGRYAEVTEIFWFDALRCGSKETAQLVMYLHDPSGTLLKRFYSFCITVGIWQGLERFGSTLLSAMKATETETLTLKPKDDKIELGSRISALSVDHKAAASAVLGKVGSGGDCRIESAAAGLKIGFSGDEELIKFSSMEEHNVEYHLG